MTKKGLAVRKMCIRDSVETNLECDKSYCAETRSVILSFPALPSGTELTVVLKGENLVYDNHDLKERAFELLDSMQIENNLKRDLYQDFMEGDDPASVVSSICLLYTSRCV